MACFRIFHIALLFWLVFTNSVSEAGVLATETHFSAPSFFQGFLEKIDLRMDALFTPPPRIQSIFPTPGRSGLLAFFPIVVTWSEPVEEDSFFAHLHISPDASADSGRTLQVLWDQEKYPNTFLIFRKPYFDQNEEVTIHIAPGVKSLHSGVVSSEEFSSTFLSGGIPPELFTKEFFAAFLK